MNDTKCDQESVAPKRAIDDARPDLGIVAMSADQGARPNEPDNLVAVAFGAYLRQLLGAKGMSQRAVAAKVGVKQPSVNRWLRGHDLPHPRHIALLAGALGQDTRAMLLAAGYTFADTIAVAEQRDPMSIDVPVFDRVPMTPQRGQWSELMIATMPVILDQRLTPERLASMVVFEVKADQPAFYLRTDDRMLVDLAAALVEGDQVALLEHGKAAVLRRLARPARGGGRGLELDDGLDGRAAVTAATWLGRVVRVEREP